MGEETQSDEEYVPNWAWEASLDPSKPDWQDVIPHELWQFGRVFFPIPNGKKAHPYPHHLDEARYKPDDEILNAYLDANSNYGISCAGDLAVVDVDELKYLDVIKNTLPDTAYQVTGSRTGEHLFFKCEGLTTRINLRVPHPEDHMAVEGIDSIVNRRYIHIGEVKCDPHGYVVGPGSRHPSGNTYGPLEGGSIAEISENELRDALDAFIYERDPRSIEVVQYKDDRDYDTDSKYEFYNLEPDDVVPWLEDGKRVPHPAHGSSTGSNFMKQKSEGVFMCWRHSYGGGEGCALNSQHLLAVMATGKECDLVRQKWNRDATLHYEAWREAIDRGLIKMEQIPYKILRGYGIKRDILDSNEDIKGNQYWDLVNMIRCEVIDDMVDWEEIE